MNDFDQETYENKIYGDYKIKNKKLTSPSLDPQPSHPLKQPNELNPPKDLPNPNQTSDILPQTVIQNSKKSENILDNLQQNGDKHINTVKNLAADIRQNLKYELHSETGSSNLTGIKRSASSMNDLTINAGGNFKRFKENHYFSKKHQIYDPFSTDFEELFGFNQSLYQNHNDFIQFYLKNKNNDSINLELLTLQKPFKISSHFYLVSLGTHYFTRQPPNIPRTQKTESILTETEETLKFGNGFCTFRMFKSFLNPGMLIFYYQSKIYVKEIDKTFYVMLPEDGIADFHNNDLLLFHTNLNDLITPLFHHIQEKQKDETEFRPYRFLENKNCLFPTILSDIIYEKILKKCTSNQADLNLDLNLSETFFKFNTTIGMNNLVCDSLEPLINQFFETQLNKYDLPKMHLGDFFFGYNHPKIQALVKLVKKNRNFSLNRFPEELRQVFCTLSPLLKLKPKLTFTDLQDLKIPLPYKCFRLYLFNLIF